MGAQVSRQNVGTHSTQNAVSGGSSLNYFNINYFKDAASSGASRLDFSQDPSKFTDPVKDVLTKGIPTLQSPTVEACGYSDRIIQITRGDTTITSQDIANAVVAYGVWPTYLDSKDATAIDKPTQPDTSTNRFYTLESREWTSDSKGWWWKLPDALKDMGVFGENMFYHSLGRAGYMIHVQCNASKFHSGTLLVVAIPEHQLSYLGTGNVTVGYRHTHPGENGREIAQVENRNERQPSYDSWLNCNGTLLGNALIFPHQFINLRTNNAATLILPYVNATPMDSMLRHNNWSLLIVPISQLRGDNSIPITISISPMAAEFSGARNRSARLEGLPVMLTPGSGQFLTTDDMQSPSVLPYFHPTQEIFIPGEVKNLVELCQVDTMVPLNNTNTSKNRIDMYALPLTRQPKTAVKLFTIPIDIASSPLNTTLLGEIASYYTHWTGSIRLSFMFCGSANSSLKLLIAYTPPGAPEPTKRKEAMLGTHIVWDVGLQSTCSLVIPWVSASHFRNTTPDTYSKAGFVTCWYQTNFVTAPEAPSTADIICLVSACKDFCLRMARDTDQHTQVGAITQNPVEQFTEAVLNEVLVVPNTQASNGSIANSAPALDAAGTGHTSSVQPEDLIETRYVISDQTRYETSLESFLGRAGCIKIITLNLDHENYDNNFKNWGINIQEMSQIRRKFEMFTYVRFDSEITIVPCVAAIEGDLGHIVIQYMYVPPGAPLPDKRMHDAWQTSTNASVFWQVGQTYPRFTIPFSSIASAYYMFYDGYDTDGLDAIYGIPVTNHMGTICVRMVTDKQKIKTKIDSRIYLKAKHIKAWCPRPPRAVTYNHIYNPNYVREGVTLETKIKYRPQVTTIGPSDMIVHTTNLMYRNYHLTPEQELDSAIQVVYTADLVIHRTNDKGDDYIPDCDCTDCCYYCAHKNRYIPIKVRYYNYYTIQESEYYPKHIQYDILLGEGPSEPGDCGGKLLCKHGVIGMVTAGGDNHVAFIDLRKYRITEAEEQGITDYVKSLGDAFGVGFVEQIKEQVSNINPLNKISAKVIKWLIRVISALVIAVRSQGDLATLSATLVLLGCSDSPWRFLKQKVCQWLGLRYVHKESDGWIKKFTEMCNAARGLEWIGCKISKFIDWLKSMLPQAQNKIKFLQFTKQLQLKEKQIDGLPYATTKQQEEYLQEMEEMLDISNKLLPLYPRENKMIKDLLKQAKNMTVASKRIEPVAVMFHGDPGSGKSICTNILARMITNPSDIYSLPPDPKYFDGYHQQTVVIMDDVMQNPNGEDMSTFCQMVSSVNYVVPMADLPDKGTLFSSDYVFCSTNQHILTPPTISTLPALNRRLFLDLTIKVNPKYLESGKLNLDCALKACDQEQKIGNARCCPLICGKAVSFVNRNNNEELSLSQVYNQIVHEHNRRLNVSKHMEAIFQGPINMQSPPPPAIVDLLRSTRNEEVINYCKNQNWIIPADVSVERELNLVNLSISILANIISIVGIIYIIYKLFISLQGPYSGLPTKKKTVPEKRIVVQGPTTEFGLSLIKHNTCVVETDNGKFTGLGIFDNVLVIPTHADPGKSVNIDGVEVKVVDSYDLFNKEGVKLEITVILLSRNEKFRDIRKYIPNSEDDYTNCNLALVANQEVPQILEVGDVVSYGNILLSGNNTARMLKYDYPTKSGFCGGVLYKVGQVIGIHVGGNGRQGFSAMLLKRYFNQQQGQIIVKKPVKEVDYPSIHTPTKTKLQPSIFHDVFPGIKEPAVLSEKDPRLQVDLNTSLFSKYAGNKQMEINEYMKVAASHYASQLETLDIPNQQMSIEDCVYGTDNLEALDLNTSAGFPYVALGIKKKDIINKSTRDISKIKNCLDTYGVDLPMITYLKDELRAPEKVKMGKTRVIEASSLNDTVHMRMLFGNLFKAFHANPGIITGCAVGCDPEVFWSKIPPMLGDGSVMAFDYTNYDGSLHPVWFKMLEVVLDRLGFPGCAVRKLSHSAHIYKGTYYEVDGGMPSGCAGTSIFNSMINNIIIRTIILHGYKNIDLDQLRILTYGDDIIFTYPDKLDMSYLAQIGEQYGLKMTPADKSDTFKDLDLSTATFLKRGFKPDTHHPFLIHPTYPIQDIYESIRWTKNPRCLQEHVLSLAHLCWHNGPEQYADFIGKIRSIPIGRNLYLPSYDVLLYEWYEKFNIYISYLGSLGI
nr:polyprotein [Human rhinovirus sp.]